MPEPIPAVVEIIWRDAYSVRDEEDQYEDYVVTTVGFLIGEDETWTRVAPELLPHGDGYRDVTCIPTAQVLERHVIKPVPTMSLMTGGS